MPTVLWQQKFRHPRDWIPQGTTYRHSVQLTDDAGNPLTVTQVTTVVLSIYNLSVTPPALIVGPRDVKNTGGGTVGSTGLLTLVFSSSDNALIAPTQSYQEVRWSLDWTHTTGTKTQHMEIDRVIARTISAMP